MCLYVQQVHGSGGQPIEDALGLCLYLDLVFASTVVMNQTPLGIRIVYLLLCLPFFILFFLVAVVDDRVQQVDERKEHKQQQ